MIKLVDDLMLMSSSDINQARELINIDSIIEEIENELKRDLLCKNIKFEYNKSNFYMRGNAILMKHALSNLIQNAIKYNTKKGAFL